MRLQCGIYSPPCTALLEFVSRLIFCSTCRENAETRLGLRSFMIKTGGFWLLTCLGKITILLSLLVNVVGKGKRFCLAWRGGTGQDAEVRIPGCSGSWSKSRNAESLNWMELCIKTPETG